MQEGHRAATLLVLLEEAFIGEEAFRETFRVVQPVDADDKLAVADRGMQLGNLGAISRRPGLAADLLDLHADGIDTGPAYPAEGD